MGKFIFHEMPTYCCEIAMFVLDKVTKTNILIIDMNKNYVSNEWHGAKMWFGIRLRVFAKKIHVFAYRGPKIT